MSLASPTIIPQHLHHTILECPRGLVGRLIGRNGTTVKGIQLFTGAVVEIVQLTDPAAITIIGPALERVTLAENIVRDIIDSRFKGFALLRQLVLSQKRSLRTPPACKQDGHVTPNQLVYAPGFGLLPGRQVSRALLPPVWLRGISSSSPFSVSK